MNIKNSVVKYINNVDPRYTWGQKADGTWYCKEFKTDSIEQAGVEISSINVMLNGFNSKNNVDEKKTSGKKNISDKSIVLEHKNKSNVKM